MNPLLLDSPPDAGAAGDTGRAPGPLFAGTDAGVEGFVPPLAGVVGAAVFFGAVAAGVVDFFAAVELLVAERAGGGAASTNSLSKSVKRIAVFPGADYR